MRIALIVPGFSADEADWCIPVLLNIVRRLAQDHEVEVFTLRYPHRRGSYELAGARVHACGGAGASGLARLPLLGDALAQIVASARRRPFDVIHGLWADEPGFVAVSASRLLAVPALVSLMGGELVALPDIAYGGGLSRINRLLTAIALQGAAGITVGSYFLRRLARNYARPDKLRTIPLGVDTQHFQPLADQRQAPLRPGAQNMLHVGSLIPVKAQATLLQALAQIVAQLPRAHLHIVGRGPLQGDLTRLAQRLGIGDALTFHGDVAHDQLPAYYRAADLYLHSSRYESQGMVLLEAAACGCPIVGTEVGLLPDLWPAALATPVGDQGALAAAAVALLGDQRRRRAMGELGSQLVKGHYRLNQTVESFVALYQVV